MPIPAILGAVMSMAGSQGGGKKGGGGFASKLPGTLEGITESLGNIGEARAGNPVSLAAPKEASATQGQPIPSIQSPGVTSGHNPDSIKAEPDKGLDTGAFKLSDENQKEGIMKSGYSEMRGKLAGVKRG